MMVVIMSGGEMEVGSVSLRPEAMGSIPKQTVRVARAALPKGCLAMRIRDTLGPIFTDTQFADVFPVRGRPGSSPAMLTMVSVLQFVENLSDRQAAYAVATRIDWKYALGLELDDTGFDYSVLSEFRDRLAAAESGLRVLDTVLTEARSAGLLRTRGRARTDSTHVLAAIRELNRTELVGETLRAALNAIAAIAPEWMATHIDPDWKDRYAHRVEAYRLPSTESGRVAWATQVGADGMTLNTLLRGPDTPPGLADLPAVRVLRQVWVQEFLVVAGEVVLRDPKDRPPAAIRLVSPYELDARTGVKRQSMWDGYKVHLTETCEPDAPHLITNVVTTVATVTDFQTTTVVHASLASRGLLPEEHLVDAGYVTADAIVAAASQYDTILVGPVMPDTTWQARAGQGYASSDFHVNWEERRVTCPRGCRSTRWEPDRKDDGVSRIKVRFDVKDCRPCPVRELCTRATSQGRNLTLLPRPVHEALQQGRTHQTTPEWQRRYEHRAGIEGTISQGTRRCGLRHARYHGLAKTTLQHHLVATAMNLIRIDAWLRDVPHATTRTPHLATALTAAA